MDSKELKEILEKHALWLQGDSKGKKADLSMANLSGAYLRGANLRRADLSMANLSGANNNIKVNRFSSKSVDFDNDRILLEIDTKPKRYHAVKKEQIEVAENGR